MPGLVELPVGQVRKDVVEHVGSEEPAAARHQQRRPVLLEEHGVLQETRRHRGGSARPGAESAGLCSEHLWRRAEVHEPPAGATLAGDQFEKEKDIIYIDDHDG